MERRTKNGIYDAILRARVVFFSFRICAEKKKTISDGKAEKKKQGFEKTRERYQEA
jgi:hypothetical protein